MNIKCNQSDIILNVIPAVHLDLEGHLHQFYATSSYIILILR